MPAFTMPIAADATYCASNPTDPACSSGPAWAQQLRLNSIYTMATAVSNNGAATGGADVSQTPIGPGTIATTASLAGFWGKIPLPVKLLGAGAIAFFGYRHYKKSKGAPLSGLFGSRRRRR